jgi:hypothetical protein
VPQPGFRPTPFTKEKTTVSWTLYAEGEQDEIESELAGKIDSQSKEYNWSDEVIASAKVGAKVAVKLLEDANDLFGDDKVSVSVNGHVPETDQQTASIGCSIHNFLAVNERLNTSGELEESDDFDPGSEESTS